MNDTIWEILIVITGIFLIALGLVYMLFGSNLTDAIKETFK